MIFFLADGRLGNQIFQYAFLKKIAKKNENIVCVNMKLFFETFALDSRNLWSWKNRYIIFICRKILIPYVLYPFAKLGVIGLVKQKRDEEKNPLPEYFEKKGFFPFVFVGTGFFQSEHFFEKEKIFSDLKITGCYVMEAAKFLSIIPEDFVKVFVHIRRMDYLEEVFMGERGIALPKQYYEKSIRQVKKEIKNPFFVFLSDDPSYVESCFGDVTPKIISRNPMRVDLAIMSLCNSAIISNSSFSWWGSALMKNRGVVIAPKYWYGWKQKIESHPDIYPSGALIIDANE